MSSDHQGKPLHGIILSELEKARAKLLDLTMRNRLLNFRPTKRTTLHIVDEVPKEVYNRLVIEKKKMEFKPRPEEDISTIQYTDQEDDDTLEEAELWSINETELNSKHIDRFLQTDLTLINLQKNLFEIRQKAHTVIEEQGHNVLFIALGFLEWKERVGTITRRAPLILIPVQLERKASGKAYQISWTEDDIISNISLQERLLDQGIKLPDFEEPEDKQAIDYYSRQMEKAVESQEGWHVSSDIYLGFFSFMKFLMYKDLDTQSWRGGKNPLTNPLLQAIFISQDEEPQAYDPEEDERLIAELDIRKQFLVVDADPSQMTVIEAVKSGSNIVVEGPPGTGKSQTITNLIAELLGEGKKVLFVSEKMAALEVVKRKLDDVGLGDYCLELHSRHTKKRNVLNELQRTINILPPRDFSMEGHFDKHDSLVRELNEYAKVLREPIELIGMTPFELYCIREKAAIYFKSKRKGIIRVPLKDLNEWTRKEYDDVKNLLNKLAEILPSVSPIARNPWNSCKPRDIFGPMDTEEIEDLISDFINTIRYLVSLVGELVKLSGVTFPSDRGKTIAALGAATVIANAHSVDPEILLLDEWNQTNPDVEKLVSDLELLKTELQIMEETFLQKAFSEDIQLLTSKLSSLDAKIFKYFILDYWKLRGSARSLYREKPKKSVRCLLEDLNRLEKSIELKNSVNSKGDFAKRMFGNHWCGLNSDITVLRSFSKWIIDFRKQIVEGWLSDRAHDIVLKGLEKKELLLHIAKIEQHLSKTLDIEKKLVERLNLDYERTFNRTPECCPFESWLQKLEEWQNNINLLPRWAQWARFRESIENTKAAPMIYVVEENNITPDTVIPTFEVNFADMLLKFVFKENPVLGDFIGEVHEKKILDFSQVDRMIIDQTRQRLSRKLYEMRPVLSYGATPSSEAGILLGQLNRKRRHLPIRKLFSNAGRLIQQLKPCFMMSPLSIAQFLNQDEISFDIVIFDEASQVRPEDALGAILRGKQLVVMGDTRQLPPTSFFDKIASDQENDEDEEYVGETSIAEVESILAQCKRTMESKMLNWHYRSQHESLIAVSNNQFYDNRLLIFPSSAHRMDGLGLELKYLPDNTYYRGSSRAYNPGEADAIVSAAINHYEKHPETSLGIGTFSQKQQRVILEKLEKAFREHPGVEKYFLSSHPEYCFVKNLETIQGDERAVIFISVGYGYDENGRLSLNFGPVNREGGERRLNVLITRARKQCVVFTNFRADDMMIDSNSPFGVRAFKAFLHYAEHRDFRNVLENSEDTDSPFEDSVYEFLRDAGYEVSKQVGVSGYFIDLAVRDPRSPGRYILAIECDGAKYHSSLVARERDRLRQQVLEARGWDGRIHRVWSTDWYRNRAETERRLLEAVKDASEKPFVYAQERVKLQRNQLLEKSCKIQRVGDIPEKGADLGYIVSVPEYIECSDPGVSIYGDLITYPMHKMAQIVQRIAVSEGPIHTEEITRRIREFWNLKRAGNRIRGVVDAAIRTSVNSGFIRLNDGFVWKAGETECGVRRRCGDGVPDIEFICDEEIAAAIKLVLKSQFSTPHGELVKGVAYLFGYQAVYDTTADRIGLVITSMLRKGTLKKCDDGRIDMA